MILTAITAVCVSGITAYLIDKAKNRAHREDIGKITEEVEKAKATFSHELERLRIKLTTRQTRGLANHEREIKLLETLWHEVWEIAEQTQVQRWLDIVELKRSVKDEKKFKQDRIELMEHILKLKKMAGRDAPFYSIEVYRGINELIKTVMSQVGEPLLNPKKFDFENEKMVQEFFANNQKINEQARIVFDAIQERVLGFDEEDEDTEAR